MNKARLIQLVKIGQRKMGWDDGVYRAWLEKHTGKRSAKDCTEAELSTAADLLRELGALDTPAVAPHAGGTGPDRPTERQWQAANSIALRIGMSGIDDARLAALLRRTAKVDSPRFLDRRGMAHFIEALTRWQASQQRKAASVAGMATPPPSIG